MSALCHKRTNAPQQTALHSIARQCGRAASGASLEFFRCERGNSLLRLTMKPRSRQTVETPAGETLMQEDTMTCARRHLLSRRGFCLCCLASASFTATGGWLTPRETFAEARNIVDLIRDDAARAPIKVHKLRRDVSILEGSGGNIAVLTGADGKVFIDAGITASRPRILEAANGLSRDPVKHLINTHWHFDHTDGNQWLNT